MRLTKIMREDFVNAVLNDTARVDYCGMAEDLLRKDTEAQVPKSIKVLIADPLIEPYIKNFYVRSNTAGSFSGVMVKGAYNIEPSSECNAKLIELQRQYNAHLDKRKALRAELFGAISKCRTTQQLSKLYPALAKYLPKDPWEPAENPPATQVIQHLIEAGFPDSEKDKQ